MKIQGLFAQPVARFDLDRGLTDRENNFLIGLEQRANQGNTTSKNNFVLRHRNMTRLRSWIEDSLSEYFKTVVNPKGDIQLRITQSWVNYSMPGQYHHKHTHPNSFISGVFYVSTNPDDRVTFFRDGYRQIDIPAAGYNAWNSDSWWFPVAAGQLILFPSSLTHMVPAVEGEHVRISLSFNTFPVGSIGEELELTNLRLEA